MNLIIKHLLPTAPALCRTWTTPPETPWLEIGGEWEREGGAQEEPEGGVAERGEQQIQRGHHHSAGFFHTAKPGFSVSAHWSYVIRTKGSRTEESDPHPPTPPPPHTYLTPTANQLPWRTFHWTFWDFKVFDLTSESLLAGHKSETSVQGVGRGVGAGPPKCCATSSRPSCRWTCSQTPSATHPMEASPSTTHPCHRSTHPCWTGGTSLASTVRPLISHHPLVHM